MAGAAAVARSYQGRNTVARTGAPRRTSVSTQNAGLRLRGDLLGGFDRVETGGMAGQISGSLRRRGR